MCPTRVVPREDKLPSLWGGSFFNVLSSHGLRLNTEDASDKKNKKAKRFVGNHSECLEDSTNSQGAVNTPISK